MFLLLCICAYLTGSIPFGKIVASMRGIDIQKKGSGNIGFANCLRILGWKFAVWVLVGDVLKGYISVYMALRYLNLHQVFFVGLCSILGHIFSIWLQWKGGKGVATGLGVILALTPVIAIITLLIFVCLIFISKTFSFSSIASSWIIVFVSVFFACIVRAL